ncbi:MAG: HU family DNA-binding protein [Mediterranea sp.]|jgi:nucleoid DNA-binding protein|nr:HU family DNA-binding protein [Mediterranea sp.]
MSEKLNSQDLIDLLVNHQGLEKKEAENFIKGFFSLIEEGLGKDRSVKIKGLGTFKLVGVESRESINVNTGERIEIQSHTKISFTPDTALRDIINKPFAHFETVILNDDIDFNDTEEEPEPEDIIIVEEKPEIIKEENEVAAIVPEKVVTVSTPPREKEKDSSKNEVRTLVIILTILICGIILFLIYNSNLFSEKEKQPLIIASPAKEIVTDSIPKDSTEKPVVAVKKPAAKPVVNNTKRKITVPFSKMPVKPDSTSYRIVGTRARHTIKEGQTLIRISYRYYGTKDLWPYLLMHNRSVIKDPNVLPLGMTINIPALKKK